MADRSPVKSSNVLTAIKVAAMLVALVVSWYFIRWNFANVAATRVDVNLPAFKPVAEWLVEIAPSDPAARFVSARLLEKTFEAEDLERSLAEYERAAALAPNNYLMWISLARARSRAGDDEGSRTAFERALYLAPNYSLVHWVYGNFLIRQDELDRGFEMVAKAAASNQEYSRNAVITALQIADGDTSTVRRYLGDSELTNASLAEVLSTQGKFGEAFDSWSKIALDRRQSEYQKLAESLLSQFIAGKSFRLAASVAADLAPRDAEKPEVGKVSNGGFESSIKLRNAGPFEWQITDAAEPQIGVSESQKRSGRFSLSVLFNAADASKFRTVSQTIAVTPGAEYELQVRYRSDIKSDVAMKWAVSDAASPNILASTPAVAMAGDWATLQTRFRVPADSDGLILQFIREGCSGTACRLSGRVSFDDIEIREVR